MFTWPHFSDQQTVIALRVFDLMCWVRESTNVLADGRNPNGMPVIAMPPVQRSAVWRPKQVLDLWDSMMRGLPIGAFYLVDACGEDRNIVLPNGRTGTINHSGFDLLDGQQRVRALLVGAGDFLEEKRCLWVDLGNAEAAQGPTLRITSMAQPFGYDADTGNKLRLDERRRARENIEPNPDHPIMVYDGTQLRRAYDQELFDDPLAQKITQPPLPYGATPAQTFKLHTLLDAWSHHSPHDVEAGIDALRTVAGDSPTREALKALHNGFSRFANAQVALLRVDPPSLRNRDKDLLALYERIGAGGTPLSQEERLYSIYKYHAPHIRDAVDAIHRQIGRVLPATKIAATALRIANAEVYPHRNDIPDVVGFAKAMAEPQGVFRSQLEHLIPTNQKTPVESAPLFRSVALVHELLSYADDAGEFWMPDVLLVAIPTELWQVLVFWAARHKRPADLRQCRQEAVRFALFWHLCVLNNEKAARWAFAEIKLNQGEHASFPGAALYELLVGSTGSDRCAYHLTSPKEFERKLCKPPTATWLTYAQRFVENNMPNELGSQWWWSGRKMLPWLQRDYVLRAFPGYRPLTDHEDDLPYDLDHMCPYNDWGNWWSVRDRVQDATLAQAMHDGRDAMGNGIGNLRLIDASKNKQEQDDDVAAKLPFIERDGPPDVSDTEAMANWAFAPEHRELWRQVSRPTLLRDRQWDENRLAAFQQAVEHRAAWLYRRFHDDLGYASWISVQGTSSSSE